MKITRDEKTGEIIFFLADLTPCFAAVASAVEGKEFKSTKVTKVLRQGHGSSNVFDFRFKEYEYKYPAILWTEPKELENADYSGAEDPKIHLEDWYRILRCGCVFVDGKAKKHFIKLELMIGGFEYLNDLIDFLDSQIKAFIDIGHEEVNGDLLLKLTKEYLTDEKVKELKGYKAPSNSSGISHETLISYCKSLRKEITDKYTLTAMHRSNDSDSMITCIGSETDFVNQIRKCNFESAIQEIIEGTCLDKKLGKQKSISNQ